MIKSMTGFSKSETKDKGVNADVEIKTLNGRYLEINCRLPRSLSYKEFELRDIVRSRMDRGTVSINLNIEADVSVKPFSIDMPAVQDIFKQLNNMKKKLKIRETVKLDHLMQFADEFQEKKEDENTELYWNVAKKSLYDALNALDQMRKTEGQRIGKDIRRRMTKIMKDVDTIETLGIERVPEERERLRQRVAQLFESDEIDEHRLQMEMVIMADKLDISEECVRLKSHLKFFESTMKARKSSGKKLNFLLQEMHREINTIGSKANDSEISQIVVNVKEELERIREQVQNIE